jgi:hypothetical protein
LGGAWNDVHMGLLCAGLEAVADWAEPRVFAGSTDPAAFRACLRRVS